jgi:hypothetical protein
VLGRNAAGISSGKAEISLLGTTTCLRNDIST